MDARGSVASWCAERADRQTPARFPSAPGDLAAWARDRELPRRVFVRSPLLAPAREQAPGAAVEFTEMLPGPGDCWLQSSAGHHTSELRVVAVDRASERRARR
jgi:hypothetical protein